MSTQSKKILLFGKTGDGKSTVANMLGCADVDGKFAAGDSLAAVTEQTKEFDSDVEPSWTIIDTVGLFGTDKPVDDHKRIRKLRNYLAEKHEAIDLFCYVKKASKFTRADEQCFQAFHTLFADGGGHPNYHDNVLLLFTSCRPGWLKENANSINDFFAVSSNASAGLQFRAPYDRSVGVDFPPHDIDEMIENKYKVTRAASLAALKERIGTAPAQPFPLQILPDEAAPAHEPASPSVFSPRSESSHHHHGCGGGMDKITCAEKNFVGPGSHSAKRRNRDKSEGHGT